MTTLDADRLPLRARRRAEVERLALDLAVEHGYDAVTVEMICDTALISSSTFFNYFGSKERAVLGPEPEPLAPERLGRFASGAGEALTELMLALVDGWPVTPEDRALLLRRLDLIHRTPALRAAHHARLERASEEVARAATQRLRLEGAAEVADRAEMVVALSHALMHWMIDRLRSEPATSWPDLVDRAVRTLVAVGVR